MKAGFGVRLVIVLIGFTASIAQIVLLRELMVVFYGNEISIGLMLASWLAWTAAGSTLAGRMAARAGNPRRLMAGIQALIAAALPCTVLAVRTAKGLLQAVPGEVLGPGSMLATSVAVLAPLCALSGALFPVGSRLCAAGSVYLWEAAGSSAGGLAAGLVLVRYLGPVEIACVLSALNLAAASVLAIAARPLRYAAIAAAVLAAVAGPRRWEAVSLESFWRGQHLIAARNSPYGSLAVVGGEGSRSVYENGVVLFNAPDPVAAEEAVDYALLEHPAPRSLLLIGGGVNGSVAEALRHGSLERVDYVELDPAILDLARDYFPDEWRAIETDRRVRVHVTDGRLFLKTTQSTFDVVIVNLPDPQNAQLNRFYTVEFFREASRRLTQSGVLSFQLRSSENYISPQLGQFLRAIHKSLWEVFPEVTAIPGETVHFFAAQRPGVLAAGADELLARLRARRLHTSYVSEYFIPFRMTPDRMADLEARIRPPAATPINRDLAPIAYYFDVALWSSQFQEGYRRLFQALAEIRYAPLAAVLAVLLAAFIATAGRRPQLAAACCTAATGFTMLGLEMLLLLGFQALQGYVYQQLAMLIAAFMAGMALGSWLAMRPHAPAGLGALAATQAVIAAAPLILIGLLGTAGAPAFPVLALLAGMLGGFEFPLAMRIFSPGGPGKLYALDLAGSCLAAVLFSLWLVPVFGFLRTALLSALVSLAPAAIAARSAAGAPRTRAR